MKQVFSIPNILSFMRIPLALAFLQDQIWIRALAIFLAMMTDSLDGYLARKYHQSSKVGTVLDPLTDKFFVFFVIGVFFLESRLSSVEVLALLSRDFAVILFGCYLTFLGWLGRYEFRSIWCGKISTALQLTLLMGLTFRLSFPSIVYVSFPILSFLALVEFSFTLGTKEPN